MQQSFRLTCVAYSRSTGGIMRLLLAVARGDETLFGGDPALLVEHRPGSEPARLRIEGPDGMREATLERIHEGACDDLAELVDEAFDRTGELRSERLLDRSVHVLLPADVFDA